MLSINTERLRLIPLDNHLLKIWHQEGRNPMEIKLGLNPSEWRMEDFFKAETEDALVNFWLPMTAQYFVNFEWYTNWEIVLTEENISIGGIGFAGMPDESGVTMVGYFIDGNYREKGYATEALKCLINWGSQEPTLKTILADTPFFNFPSQNVLKKVGFREFAIAEVFHLEKMQVKNWKLKIR